MFSIAKTHHQPTTMAMICIGTQADVAGDE